MGSQVEGCACVGRKREVCVGVERDRERETEREAPREGDRER